MGLTLERATHQYSGVLYRGVINTFSYIKKTSALTTFLYRNILGSTTSQCLTSSRKISVISRKLIPPLKKVRIVSKADISRSHWQQVRQEHTQKEETGEEEKASHKSEKKSKGREGWEWTKKNMIFFLQAAGVGGSIGITTLLYFYKNPPSKEWIEFVAKVHEFSIKVQENRILKYSKDFSVAQDLVDELRKLRNLIGGDKNFIDFTQDLIEKSKKQHEEEIKKLGDEYNKNLKKSEETYAKSLEDLHRDDENRSEQLKNEYISAINQQREEHEKGLKKEIRKGDENCRQEIAKLEDAYQKKEEEQEKRLKEEIQEMDKNCRQEIAKLEDAYQKKEKEYEKRVKEEIQERDENCRREIAKLEDAYYKKETEINKLKAKYQEALSDHRNNQTAMEQVVSLYGQCAGDGESFEVLTKFLNGKETVTYGGGPFSSKSMNALKVALQSNLNPSVTGLSFYGSRINASSIFFTNDALTSLMQGLKNNKTIVSLDLGYTDIGRMHVLSIAEMLRENSTLQELSLYYGYLKDEDVDHLKTALMNNKTLKKLNLRDNTSVTDAKKKELRDALHIEIL